MTLDFIFSSILPWIVYMHCVLCFSFLSRMITCTFEAATFLFSCPIWNLRYLFVCINSSRRCINLSIVMLRSWGVYRCVCAFVFALFAAWFSRNMTRTLREFCDLTKACCCRICRLYLWCSLNNNLTNSIRNNPNKSIIAIILN